MTARRRLALRLAVATVAFCTLAYEIALTRIFSVLFRSPYVFLILSVAVCGSGLGAALAAALDSRSDGRRAQSRAFLGGPLLGFAFALPVPLLLLLTVASGLVADARGVLVAVVTAVPYVFGGLFLARAFQQQAGDAGRLYFYDLTGAGVAALVAAALLSTMGGVAVPIALGGLAALAAAALSWPRRSWSVAGVVVALVCFAGTAYQAQTQVLGLPLTRSTDDRVTKPLFRELNDPAAGAKVLYTEWSPVARTDVVSNAGTDTLYIWTDGDVPTQMEPFKGQLQELESFRGFIGFIPFGLRPNPDRVLCIGPGGGLDCLLALLGGAKAVEPVEINPAIGRVVDRYRNFYGDLYRRPEMDHGLIIDEGRSYMSRSPRRYDVIYFALAKSATTQQGGLALVDNYLYTREAFEAYWSKLSDRGMLALVFQNRALVDRCLVTMTDALLGAGLTGTQIADRVAYLGLREGFESTPYQFVLLLSKSPFDDRERGIMAGLGRSLDLRYAPKVAEKQPYAALRTTQDARAFGQTVAGQDDYLVRMAPGRPWVRLNLSPVTDDLPFYADMAPGLNPLIKPALSFGLWSGALALLAAAMWLVWRRRRGRGHGTLAEGGLAMAYFAGLGAAFLLVEVALIQKLVLILGYPTLSLTVILFALLMGSGLGGLRANRGSAEQAMQRLRWLAFGLVVWQVALALGAPALGRLVLGAPLWVRVAAVVAVVMPLGVLMGQPFPSGLRFLSVRGTDWVPLAWAVNGVLSVTGSVLAAALASMAGYRVVLLTGAVLYAMTCGLGLVWLRQTRHESAGSFAAPSDLLS